MTPEQVRDHIDLKTSQRIINEGPECIDDALGEFENYLTPYHNERLNKSGKREPDAALAILNDERRALQRVFSQLIADELTPMTSNLLDTGTLGLELITQEVGTLDDWEGARYRHFLGDEARFAAAYEALFGNATQNMFRTYTSEQADMFIEANRNITQRVKNVAERAKQGLGKTSLTALLAEEPYVGIMESQRVSMHMRSISFQSNPNIHARANNGLRTDLRHQLQANAVAFGEFYGSVLGAMLPYEFRQAGYDDIEQQFTAELGSIAPISATAAVKDSSAEDVLFAKRDEPCFTVTPDETGWLTIDVVDAQKPLKTASDRIRNVAATKLGKAGAEKLTAWGRCPSNQVLTTDRSVSRGTGLVDQIDQLTGGRAPEHLRVIITSADICAITGVGLMMQLWRRGVVGLRPSKLSPTPRKEPELPLHIYRQAVGDRR